MSQDPGDSLTVKTHTLIAYGLFGVLYQSDLSCEQVATEDDLLTSALESGRVTHNVKHSPFFLKTFVEKGSPPDSTEFGIQDAVKTMYLLEKCSTSDIEMTDDELTEMASLMMRLTENADWNNNSTTELLFQTRTIQQNAESIGRKVSDASGGKWM